MIDEKVMEPLISKSNSNKNNKNEQVDETNTKKKKCDFFYTSILYVFVYVLVGSLLYYFIFTLKDNNSKDADYIDTIYFCLVTLTTVGYGDFHPHDDSSKLFTCLYIIFGIGFIAYCLSYFINKILEKQEEIVVKTIQKNTHDIMDDDDEHHVIKETYCCLTVGKEERRVLFSSIWLGFLILVGIIVYDQVDDRTNFVESLYFVIVSISTVGYGDVSPNTTVTKLFSVLWLAVTTLSFANTISAYIEYSSNKTIEILRYKLIHKKIDLYDFNKIDEDNDGILSKFEWLKYQIIEGKYPVDENDINEIMDRYNELDKDNSGNIYKKELDI